MYSAVLPKLSPEEILNKNKKKQNHEANWQHFGLCEFYTSDFFVIAIFSIINDVTK